MNLSVLPPSDLSAMEPLSCRMDFGDIPVGGIPFRQALTERLTAACRDIEKKHEPTIFVNANVWPSRVLAERLTGMAGAANVIANDGRVLVKIVPADSAGQESPTSVPIDKPSIEVVYPWHILAVHEELMAAMTDSLVDGDVHSSAVVNGPLVLGEGSVVLPGVVIEGPVVVGRHCRIGPNAYLRPQTALGDHVHVGQAVEIKNSILMDHVSAGHLSYMGDSIVCRHVNFGAGTILSNLRHDGCHHRSMANGRLVDTGRRKWGAVVGEHVHTGIHTAIYPGRKLWPDTTTRPGAVVDRDLCARMD